MSITIFPEQLEAVHSALGKREGVFDFLWPSERAVYDTCGAIGFIECEGLYAFWRTDGISHGRVARAFRKVGAYEVADLISASSPLRRIIRNGEIDYDKRHSNTQWRDKFGPMESRLLGALKSAPPLIQAFAAKRRVNGAPPSALTYLMGYLVGPFRIAGWLLEGFWEAVRDAQNRPNHQRIGKD